MRSKHTTNKADSYWTHTSFCPWGGRGHSPGWRWEQLTLYRFAPEYLKNSDLQPNWENRTEQNLRALQTKEHSDTCSAHGHYEPQNTHANMRPSFYLNGAVKEIRLPSGLTHADRMLCFYYSCRIIRGRKFLRGSDMLCLVNSSDSDSDRNPFNHALNSIHD